MTATDSASATGGMDVPPPAPNPDPGPPPVAAATATATAAGAGAGGAPADPDKLRSDLDTIKGVLKRGDQANEPHRMLIGAGNLVFAFFTLLAAGVVLVALSIPLMAGAGEDGLIPLGIGAALALFLSLISIPFFLAGYGLLKKKSWGPAMAIIAGVINLLDIPIGTAFSIYTFWAVIKGKLEMPPEEGKGSGA